MGLLLYANKVDETFALLDAIDQKTGSSLVHNRCLVGNQKALAHIEGREQWVQRREKLSLHNDILDKTLRYMTLSSDKSGLTLDPEMDAFS